MAVTAAGTVARGARPEPPRRIEVGTISEDLDSGAGAPPGGRPDDRTAPVADRGSDPDYRFTLANERTFLAWFRTALALIAGGVAVVQLVPEFAFSGARHALGVLLTLSGGGLSLVAVLRWRRVQEAMRHDRDLPPTPIPAILGAGLAALTAFVVVLLLISSWRRG